MHDINKSFLGYLLHQNGRKTFDFINSFSQAWHFFGQLFQGIQCYFKMRYEQRVRPKRSDQQKEFYIRRVIWSLITGICLFLIGWKMHIGRRFSRGNYLQKNSFRFCVIMLIIFVILATFLVVMTWKHAPGEDVARKMQAEYPIAAYTMTAIALFLIVGTFLFFTDLLKAFGILFFFAFWGFFFNIIFVFSFPF